MSSEGLDFSDVEIVLSEGVKVKKISKLKKPKVKRLKKPRQKKPKRKKTLLDRILIFFMNLFLIAGLVLAGYRFYEHWKEAHLKDITHEVTAGFDLPQETGDIPPDLVDKLRELFQNEDIIAYLVVPDAGIEYPVVQGETNDTYLRHDIYGNYTIYGSIFLDSDCSPDFKDRASVIYGHHMIDKTMFGGLASAYENGVDGKYFMVYTREKALRYDLIASTRTEAYGINPYLGYAGQTTEDFINDLKARALTWGDSVKYSEMSRFVSLMTCWGDGKTYRYGVTGVLKDKLYIKDDLEKQE